MTQEALKELLEAVEAAIQAGDWKVDGACDPDLAIRRAKEALAQPEQEPVAWRVSPRYEDSDGYFDFTDSKDTADTLQKRGWTITPLYTTPPQRKPLTDVIQAAQSVLEWIEIQHRPPVRDVLEGGRMVRVRLHALADLHDALAAHNIKENT